MAFTLGARPQLPNASKGINTGFNVEDSTRNLELLAANLSSGLGALRPRSIFPGKSAIRASTAAQFPLNGDTLLDQELGFSKEYAPQKGSLLSKVADLRDVTEEVSSSNPVDPIFHSGTARSRSLQTTVDPAHDDVHGTSRRPHGTVTSQPLHQRPPPSSFLHSATDSPRDSRQRSYQEAEEAGTQLPPKGLSYTVRAGYPAYGPPPPAALFAVPLPAPPPLPPTASQSVLVRSPQGRSRSRSPSSGRQGDGGQLAKVKARVTSHPAAGQEYQPPGLRGISIVPISAPEPTGSASPPAQHISAPIPGMLLRGSGTGGGKGGTFAARQATAVSEEQRRVAERVGRASLAAARAFTSTLPAGRLGANSAAQEANHGVSTTAQDEASRRHNPEGGYSTHSTLIGEAPRYGQGGVRGASREDGSAPETETGSEARTLPDRVSEGLIRDLLLMAATIRSEQDSSSLLLRAQSEAQWQDPARAFPLTLDRALSVLRSPIALQQEMEGYPQYTEPQYIPPSASGPSRTVLPIPSAATHAGPVVATGMHRVGGQPLAQGLDSLGPQEADSTSHAQPTSTDGMRSTRKGKLVRKARVRPVSSVELASGWGPAHDKLYSHIVLQLPRLVAEGVVQLGRGSGSQQADVAEKREDTPLPHPGLLLAVASPLLSSLQDMLCDVDVVTLLREAVASKVQERLARALSSAQTSAPAASGLASGPRSQTPAHEAANQASEDNQLPVTDSRDENSAQEGVGRLGLSPTEAATGGSGVADAAQPRVVPSPEGAQQEAQPEGDTVPTAKAEEESQEYSDEGLGEEQGFYSASEEEYGSDGLGDEGEEEIEDEEDTDF